MGRWRSLPSRSDSRAFNAVPIGPYGGRANQESLLAFGPVVQGGAGGPLMPVGLPAEGCPCLGGTFDPNSGTAKSYAVYGQTTWTPAALDQWHFTLGLRYSYDKKTGDLGTPTGKPTVDEMAPDRCLPVTTTASPNLSGNWDGVQYKVGVEYEVTGQFQGIRFGLDGLQVGRVRVRTDGRHRARERARVRTRHQEPLPGQHAAVQRRGVAVQLHGPGVELRPAVLAAVPVERDGPAGLLGQHGHQRQGSPDGGRHDRRRLAVHGGRPAGCVVHVRVQQGPGRPLQEDGRADPEGWRAVAGLAEVRGHQVATATRSRWRMAPRSCRRRSTSGRARSTNTSTIQKTIIAAGVVYERPFDPRYTTIRAQGILDLSLKFAPASDAWDVTAYLNNATDELDIKSLSFNDNRNTAASSTTGHQTASLGDPRIWGLIFNVRF